VGASLSAGQTAFAEKRVALVIGNANYALAPLTNPTNDADDLAVALKRLQFDVTEKKDLAVHDFDRALDDFIPSGQNADVALFFFSGHGVQIDKRGYLAPTDVNAESESSALRELVAIQEVVSRIENAAKVSVIILDACRTVRFRSACAASRSRRTERWCRLKGCPRFPLWGVTR